MCTKHMSNMQNVEKIYMYILTKTLNYDWQTTDPISCQREGSRIAQDHNCQTVNKYLVISPRLCSTLTDRSSVEFDSGSDVHGEEFLSSHLQRLHPLWWVLLLSWKLLEKSYISSFCEYKIQAVNMAIHTSVNLGAVTHATNLSFTIYTIYVI
jgi:hypothetical protein